MLAAVVVFGALLESGEPKKMEKGNAASMFSKMMKKKPAAAAAGGSGEEAAPVVKSTGELFDDATALGISAELLDEAMDSDDPKAALRTMITQAETTGRTGDGKKIGKLGKKGVADRIPRGKSFPDAEPKGPRTPKPDEAPWEAGVLDLTTENFRLSVASPRPVLVWITTPIPSADATDPESKERREYAVSYTPQSPP